MVYTIYCIYNIHTTDITNHCRGATKLAEAITVDMHELNLSIV